MRSCEIDGIHLFENQNFPPLLVVGSGGHIGQLVVFMIGEAIEEKEPEESGGRRVFLPIESFKISKTKIGQNSLFFYRLL